MIVKFPDCGKGVNKDTLPEELADGVWSDCHNMRFRNGFAEKVRGIAQVFDDTDVPTYYITSHQTPYNRFWIHAGAQHVYAETGSARHEITPSAGTFTGSQDDRWSGGTFSGNLIMNNGIDVPHYWNGDTSSNLTSLTGWNSAWRADVVVPFREYLFALSVTKSSVKYPNLIKWSAAGGSGTVPSSWDETDVTKDAGEKDLAETSDLIVDALPMGDSLIIYKQRSMFVCSFIGSPYIFRFQRLPGEDGLFARGCVVDTPVGHVLMTSGDVVIHSGSGCKSIADGIVREYIFRNISTDHGSRSFLVTNPQKSEVIICFPEQNYTSCNKAAVWNWKSETWGFRSISDVTYGAVGQIPSTLGTPDWDDDADPWYTDVSIWNENDYSANELRCFLSYSDKIGAFDIGSEDFGEPYDSSIERVGISLGDPYQNKLVRAIYPRIEANNGTQVSIEVGASMTADTPPTYQHPVTFTVGTDIKADCFASGRFIAVRVTNSSTTAWRMRSFDLDVVPVGAY